MFRVINLLVLMVAITTAFALYRVKYEVSGQAREVASLRGQIAHEKDRIALLQAEWSHLNEPNRVQELATRFLDLQPTDAHQIVTFADLPQRTRGDQPYIGEAAIEGGEMTTGSLR